MAEAPRSMEIGSHLQRMSCYSALIAERLGLERGPDPDRQPPARRGHGGGLARGHRQAGRADPERAPRARGAPRRSGTRCSTGSGVELLETAAEIALHATTSASTAPATRAGWRARRSRSPGRIAAVADAFDALTTDRDLPHARAASSRRSTTLRAERGRHFDPRVVDAFLRATRRGASRSATRYAPPPEEQPAIAARGPRRSRCRPPRPTLAISPSRLRRWADEGRIASVRTAGGHRRFSLAAVRRLAAESGVRPDGPPRRAARRRRCRCWPRTCAPTAASSPPPPRPRSTARARPAGSPPRPPPSDLRDWMTDLGASCESGGYAARAAGHRRR